MAILPLCTICNKTNRYAEKEGDRICAKCKVTKKKPKFDENGTFVAEAKAKE